MPHKTIIQRVENLEKKNFIPPININLDQKVLINRIEKLEEIIEKMGFYIPRR
jgi:hypothetical protein